MNQLTFDFPVTTELPVDFYPNFLQGEEADRLFQLSQQLEWRQNSIQTRFRPEPIQLPRQESMYGDCRCNYIYSGVTLTAQPWTDWLAELRDRIEHITFSRYQVVIGNRYLDGSKHIGYHADDSPEMGKEPAIASLSLGATRRFGVRCRATKETTAFELTHGSLIFMRPGCQTTHVHCIAKTAKPVGERINWTFRPHIGSAA
jgi:alkylated DNA repair dioxygenase AlkB